MQQLIAEYSHYFLSHFTEMGNRTYWVFLLSSFMLAFLVYVQRVGSSWSLAGFSNYVFDKKVWLHPSSKVDYAYFFLNAIVMFAVFYPMLAIIYPAISSGWITILGMIGLPAFNAAPEFVWLLYFIAMVLMVDFMVFLGHYLAHKVPVLWEFHKVHHSAEVLNPITLYRQHPMDFILNGILVGTGSALVHASFAYVFSTPFSIWEIGALNVTTLAFYLLGYNLRHSHIRLSFGRFDKWLISPEQHQLHHSCVPKHFDKNMGLILAVWDRLFRTHYIPEKDEEIILGLPDNESAEFDDPFKLLILPFLKAIRSHQKGAMIIVASLGIGFVANANKAFQPKTVFLEEMTWEEVDQAMNSGYTSVIIPTGGVEQNGAHVSLGKHNRVIAFTSEQIARQLGDTLVAPVMKYVPEGDIETKEGHMQYPGTLSVREEVFEMVLEDTVNSLLQHGFQNVYIIGDSGQSQDSQKRVAEKMTTDLDMGRTVIQVGNYYYEHGQTGWLAEQGFTQESIGWHAGIRDTSEVLFVSPADVRADQMVRTTQSKGADGAYWKSSKDIGETMLQLKIDAAVKQIAEERLR